MQQLRERAATYKHLSEARDLQLGQLKALLSQYQQEKERLKQQLSQQMAENDDLASKNEELEDQIVDLKFK